jgi:hypothetical protein
MSSSKRAIAALLALGLSAPLLAACSLTPAYQQGAAVVVPLSYARPASRVEQVIYQRLSATLGTAGAGAPMVTVNVTQAVQQLTRSQSPSPLTQKQLVLSANVTVVRDDGVVPETLMSQRFSATASFTTNGQVLADRAAEDEASERAAQSLAETIRLALIARLSPR